MFIYMEDNTKVLFIIFFVLLVIIIANGIHRNDIKMKEMNKDVSHLKLANVHSWFKHYLKDDKSKEYIWSLDYNEPVKSFKMIHLNGTDDKKDDKNPHVKNICNFVDSSYTTSEIIEISTELKHLMNHNYLHIDRELGDEVNDRYIINVEEESADDVILVSILLKKELIDKIKEGRDIKITLGAQGNKHLIVLFYKPDDEDEGKATEEAKDESIR